MNNVSAESRKQNGRDGSNTELVQIFTGTEFQLSIRLTSHRQSRCIVGDTNNGGEGSGLVISEAVQCGNMSNVSEVSNTTIFLVDRGEAWAPIGSFD